MLENSHRMALKLVTEFNYCHFIFDILVIVFVLPHVFVIGGPFALSISGRDQEGLGVRRGCLPPQIEFQKNFC